MSEKDLIPDITVDISFETESGLYDESNWFDLRDQEGIMDFVHGLFIDEVLDILINDKSTYTYSLNDKFYDMLVEHAKQDDVNNLNVCICGIVYA